MASLLAWASLRPGSACCRSGHNAHAPISTTCIVDVDPHPHPARLTTCQLQAMLSKEKKVQACIQTVHAHSAISQWLSHLRHFRPFSLASQGPPPTSGGVCILPLFFWFRKCRGVALQPKHACVGSTSLSLVLGTKEGNRRSWQTSPELRSTSPQEHA